MCQKFNPVFNFKLSGFVPNPAKAIDYAQKIEREFLLVEGIQQTVSHMVMSIDMTAGKGSMRQQRLANITGYKCGQKVVTEKTALVQLVQVQHQIKL